MRSGNLYFRLWRHIASQRRKQLVLLLVVALLASVAEVLSIGAVIPFLGVLLAPENLLNSAFAQPLISALDIREARQLIFPITAIFIGAAILSGLVRLGLLWMQSRIGFAIGADLSTEAFKRSLNQPYQIHVENNSSEVIAAISTKINMVINFTLLPLLFSASASIIAIFILVALFVLNPTAALAAFGGFGGFYLIIFLFTKRRLESDSLRISEESSRVVKILQEGLGGIRDVLIDGSQEAFCKLYRDADTRLRKAQAHSQIIAGMPRYVIESLGIALIAIMAYGMTEVEGGISNSLPIIVVFAVGAQRLLPVFHQIYSSWSNIKSSRSAFEDVLFLLERPLPKFEQKTPPLSFLKSICLHKVGFRYSENNNLILRDISFTISRGSRIGLMGATGCGKSTLIDLIMGLLSPTIGNIFVDGVPITFRNARGWQANIAHVPQSIFLADCSISENIAFGIAREQIDPVRLKYAANKAQIAATIESWPDQYETFVGERGIRISGGQRQRIGIARALYKRANLIVLDEATSALDDATEGAVIDTLNSMGRDITIIMVAHRLSTLAECDFVVELEDGFIKRTWSARDGLVIDAGKEV